MIKASPEDKPGGIPLMSKSASSESIFNKRPSSREERAYSVSASGHVFVNVREVLASPAAKKKLVDIAKRVGAGSKQS